MKKNFLIFFIMISEMNAMSMNKIDVLLPETYELSNIILALTNYGQADNYEVLKSTTYYQEVIAFFEPAKNHPLLTNVNYSREKWEDYLSFRTDAFAFQFDENNKLYRYIDFYTVDGHTPFDKNLELINDFVEKSNFRQFFREHKSYYDFIQKNYSDYYFVDKSWSFLTDLVEKQNHVFKYFIVLSPLVNRMNCHRDISKNIIADFPAATSEFLNQVMNDNDLPTRLDGNHGFFTEMDHGFVNPISEKFQKIILENFNYNRWDNNSGYTGIDVFNEYMTWAVWDIFIKENFPEKADSVIMQWQYQNATRGFFAHKAFSDKLFEIWQKNQHKSLESLYLPLLKWCKSAENNLSMPTISNFIQGQSIGNRIVNNQLFFSEPMQQSELFDVILSQMQNGREIGNSKTVFVNNVGWSENGKEVSFDIETDFKDCVVLLSYWGLSLPLVSQNNIVLQPQSYVLIKNKSTDVNQPHEKNNKKSTTILVISAIIVCLLVLGACFLLKK
jgi:hypothetical protein